MAPMWALKPQQDNSEQLGSFHDQVCRLPPSLARSLYLKQSIYSTSKVIPSSLDAKLSLMSPLTYVKENLLAVFKLLANFINRTPKLEAHNEVQVMFLNK